MQTTNDTRGLDIIGDIHGHCDTLRALLAKLDYRERGGAYRHPERQAVFVGDFIDRGPKIRESLHLVRAMVEAGSARACLGNHEFSALCYHTPGPDGEPLRAWSARWRKTHGATAEQLVEPHPREWAEWLGWFRTLPWFLDFGGLRVVHAAWHAPSIALLRERPLADLATLQAAGTRGTAENAAMRLLLHGPDLLLPPGCEYRDKEGHAWPDIRVRWFGREAGGLTYRGLVLPPCARVPDVAVDAGVLAGLPCYGAEEPPVIFGHYWLPPGTPRCLGRNVACVDYSVAAPGGTGVLAAYRWNGERTLRDEHFVVQGWLG